MPRHWRRVDGLSRARFGIGNYLTRTALRDVLARNGIKGDTLHLAYLMMDCEIDHVICSGPRQGKQSTYALVDERAPKQRRLAGDEALAELTRRYFTSHGPATVHDFAWWSGLTIGHAKRGLEALGKGMTSETLNDVTYWSAPPKARRAPALAKQPAVLLLPNYDEYLNALKDRSLALDPLGAPPTLNSFIGVPHQLVIDGILRGAWRRVNHEQSCHDCREGLSSAIEEREGFPGRVRRLARRVPGLAGNRDDGVSGSTHTYASCINTAGREVIDAKWRP